MNLQEQGGERPAPAQVVQQGLSGITNLPSGEGACFCGQPQLASLGSTALRRRRRNNPSRRAAELHALVPLLLKEWSSASPALQTPSISPQGLQ